VGCLPALAFHWPDVGKHHFNQYQRVRFLLAYPPQYFSQPHGITVWNLSVSWTYVSDHQHPVFEVVIAGIVDAGKAVLWDYDCERPVCFEVDKHNALIGLLIEVQ